MKTRLLGILLLMCLALPWCQAQARDLKVIFSQYTPPYVFENGEGIVVEIVRASLEPAGYKVIPVYAPIGRGFELFSEKRVDGTTIIRENSGLQANYSDEFMRYHNKVFAPKARKLVVRGLEDLKGKHIIAFQNAHKYLDTDFGSAVADNPNYKETANQETQVLMLLLGRTDLAVLDESIFRFYREKLIAEGKVPHTADYDVFPIFAPTPYKTAFVDPQVRDDFNRGLAALRRDGRYVAIYRKYIEKYFSVKQ